MLLRALLLLCAIALLGTHAAAEDKGAPTGRLPTPAEAAAEVERAIADGDQPALRRASARSKPDPWLVVDHLISEKAFDAAAAFVGAMPDAPRASLTVYVAKERDRKADEEDRQIFAAVLAATMKKDAAAAIEAATDLEGTLDSVPRVRTRLLHGLSLEGLNRSGAAARQFLAAARGAEAIGWTATALPAYQRAVQHARLHSDWRLAIQALERVIVMHEKARHLVPRAWAYGNLGVLHEQLAEYPRALECQAKALELLEGREELGRVRPVVLGNIGNVHVRRGDYAKAQEVLSAALALMVDLGDEGGEARVLGSLATLREHEGHLQEALKIYEDLKARHRERRDGAAYALVLGNEANVLVRLGDFPRARAAFEAALTIRKSMKDRAGIATTLGNMAVLYHQMGDHARALSLYSQSRALKHEIGDRASEAATLASMGLLHLELGDFARALSIQEQVLDTMKAIGDTPGIARVYVHLGNIHLALQGLKQALFFHEKALEIVRRLGNRMVEAELLQAMGAAYLNQERYAESLKFTRQALGLHAQIGDKQGKASCLTRLGELQHLRGKPNDAIEKLGRAEKLLSELGDESRAAMVAQRIGAVLLDMGKLEEAQKQGSRAVRQLRSLRSNRGLLDALELLAKVEYRRGRYGLALGHAREAMQILERALGGLAEIEGARTRDRHVDLYDIGVLCAHALGEPEEALTFLEAGRSGSLLHALSSSPTHVHVPIALPKALREAKDKAESRHRLAERALRRATRLGDFEAKKAAHAEVREVELELARLLGRIQREAKRQAAVLYPRPRTLRQIRKVLGDGDVLVMYGVCMDKVLALVIGAAEPRMVELGSATDLRKACAACTSDDPDEAVGTALADLRTKLVDPLNLSPKVKRVLASPADFLSYVPFGALFSGRPVVLTPSGTTHVHLKSLPPARGTDVLSLGGPLYGVRVDPSAARIYARGGALRPLPKSKEEAEAVGDTVLIGPQATEAGLRAALATKPRWRAVHLACHGRVDPDRPVFSSLALTRGDDDDGFLTCYEILGMSMPADLVVLSACATAQGQLWRSEGIIGLTRAFMYAGSPRVMCSLWKVDDEATMALMVKFYDLWNPNLDKDGKPVSKPLPAEEALRQAQAYVRKQKDWEHPYYWAAWVLWGLPDD